jgi:hypothetical protein
MELSRVLRLKRGQINLISEARIGDPALEVLTSLFKIVIVIRIIYKTHKKNEDNNPQTSGISVIFLLCGRKVAQRKANGQGHRCQDTALYKS